MGLISMKEIAEKSQNLKTDKSKQERKRTEGVAGRQNKGLWDNTKRSNIQVIGVLQRNQRLGQKE